VLSSFVGGHSIVRGKRGKGEKMGVVKNVFQSSGARRVIIAVMRFAGEKF